MYVPFRNARRNTMSNNSHLPEWKRIKGKYETMIELGFTVESPEAALKFRIECIDSLIESENNSVKEIGHFK